MIGKALEVVIPGPGSKFHTGNAFWNFMNPGPFSESLAFEYLTYLMANISQISRNMWPPKSWLTRPPELL
jgi:hypothetical protein